MKTIIYKEDAIKAIPSTTIDVFENCRNCKLLSREEVIEILESLPPAQPERKTGEWIKKGGKHICPNCGSGYGNAQLPHSFNYCPNCGEKMVT